MDHQVGIFEAKTKLSELCTQVEEAGAEYVITRRGRPVARITGFPADRPEEKSTGILERMRRTAEKHGPVADEEPDFPDVWTERRGIHGDPLE